jgi:hypothetical protein
MQKILLKINIIIKKILGYEYNKWCIAIVDKENFLKNISKNDSDIYVKNYALGNKNEDKFFYMPYYKSTFVHYFSSFDKEYIYQSIKMTFSKKFTKFKILIQGNIGKETKGLEPRSFIVEVDKPTTTSEVREFIRHCLIGDKKNGKKI